VVLSWQLWRLTHATPVGPCVIGRGGRKGSFSPDFCLANRPEAPQFGANGLWLSGTFRAADHDIPTWRAPATRGVAL